MSRKVPDIEAARTLHAVFARLVPASAPVIDGFMVTPAEFTRNQAPVLAFVQVTPVRCITHVMAPYLRPFP